MGPHHPQISLDAEVSISTNTETDSPAVREDLKTQPALGSAGATMKSLDDYKQLLDVVILLNKRYLANHPDTPQFSVAGMHKPNIDGMWRSLPTVLKLGGDVDDLACWLVAELRAKNVKCEIAIRGEPGKWLTCFVQLEDGTMLDPLQMIPAVAILGASGEKSPFPRRRS